MATEYKPPNRQLLSKIFNNNHEMIKTFEDLFRINTNVSDALDLLQKEIDKIEAGAGLETDGTYISPSGTNYLDSSTSLADADLHLDVAIGNIESRQKIINKSVDYQALNENQIIIVDAITGDVNIILPNPVTFLDNTFSNTIGITKKDITNNKVNILPFASELIVGETSQYINQEGEVLNFITDGINWYLNN